jgi:uncharacterized membrane protein
MNPIPELTALFKPAFILISFIIGVFVIGYLSNLLIKKNPKGMILIYFGAVLAVILLLYPYFYLAYPNDTFSYLLKALISLPLIFFIPGYITYNAFVKEKFNLDFSEVVFLQILTSILISGWIALTLAELGYFSLFNLLIPLIVFSVVLGWKYKVKFRLESFPKPELNYKSIALVAILLIAFTLFFHPYPWILGGRDPGVYVNTGVNIANTGSIIIHDPLLASCMDETMQKAFYQIVSCPEVLNKIKYEGIQFLGFYITDKTTGEITPPFFYLWTTWIAIFYSLFELEIGLYVTSFFALLSILSIFFSGKTLFNKNVGLIASLILALNFAQIWYARYPTTEVFTQLLIFSGIATFILFNRTSNNYFGVISALCFGESFLIRIDTVYLLVPIILFFGYLWLSDRLRRQHLYFIIPFILLSIHAFITAVFISAPYTFDVLRLSFRSLFLLINNKSWLLLIGLMALGAFFILLSTYKDKVASIFNRGKKVISYLQFIAACLIFILVLYAYFIRPSGAITSDSYNLVKLSWYMSGFCGILLAGLGSILLLYKKPYSETYFFLTTFFIYAAFYIANARIFPDYPWWVRRYLPVVIPSAILCISYFVDWIKNLTIGKTQLNKIITIILLFFLLVPFIMADSKIICHTEYDGAIEATEELSNIFERNSEILYVRNSYTIKVALPLYYIYGKDIRPVTISERSVDYISEQISSNKTIYLVDVIKHNDVIRYKNESLFTEFYISWAILRGMQWKNYGYFFIPEDIRTEKHVFSILALKDLSDLNEFQILNSNWHALEHWRNIPTRWTSNNSIIFINSSENRNSNVSFKVISFYKPRTLQVYLNDELIHEQKVLTSFVEIKLPLKLKTGRNIIRFYTPDGCQRPIDIPELKNKDSRCLSLGFQNISLTPIKMKYDVDFTDYSIPDLMAVDRFYSFNITIKNTGTEKWNKNGENPVYVSYHWLKDGKVVLWDGIRNKLPCDVPSENTIKVNMNIETPREKGNYTLIVDLVKEYVTWFETQGAVPLKKNITVTEMANM